MNKQTDMEPILLKTAFKGERDYLQGGDLYNAIIKSTSRVFPEILKCGLKLSFHDFLRKRPLMFLSFSPMEIPKNRKMAVDFNFQTQNGKPYVWGQLFESEELVQERNPYNESVLHENCNIRDKVVTLQGESEYSIIEIAVSMTKLLHQKLYSEIPGKWIFTRLDIKKLLREGDADSIEIALQKNLGSRLTRSEIRTKNGVFGNIFFTLLK